MTGIDKALEMRFDSGRLGLSVRRIREHTKYRQINPFADVTAASAARPEQYVDVVDLGGAEMALTGYTLANVSRADCNASLPRPAVRRLLRHAKSARARQWLALLSRHLKQVAEEDTLRRSPGPFLGGNSDDPLGVAGLQCALATWLGRQRTDRASGQQWLDRIRNLAGKGLRLEELQLCKLEDHLGGRSEVVISGAAVLNLLNYQTLGLSIIPMGSEVQRKPRFEPVSARAARSRGKPNVTGDATTRPELHDKALGYRVDFVEWDDLLGHQRGWMVFTRSGKTVVSPDKPTGLCPTYRQAARLAASHARKVHTRFSTRGSWRQYRLAGGKYYREWLITLPHYAHSFYSSHFPVRNVLLHVRCDLWPGVDGSDVLVLQEVQSDWAQQARRANQAGDPNEEEIPTPPWLQEWPALALKLMLLHAARRGIGALAWTPGSIQVERYDGLGESGLLALYDRTLPTAATRLLRPHGRQCRRIGVFQPAEAHENLVSMHGVKLDAGLREELLGEGFYAWGGGIA